MEGWASVVLAAGQSVRMKSKVPKGLHPVCGKEMVRYPVELLCQLGIKRTVLVVSPSNIAAIREVLGDVVEYVIQPEALGTGDALLRARDTLEGQVDHIFVQHGDVPLVTLASAQQLVARHLTDSNQATILTATITAADLGTIRRNSQGLIVDIVEAATMQPQIPSQREVNGGVYCFQSSWLWEGLERLEASPKGERYLTSVVSIGSARGGRINSVTADDPNEIQGVNTRIQLAQVEAVQRQRIRERCMRDGVTLLDPASVLIDDDVAIGRDTVILPNTMLLGQTTIGEECEIGPNCVIRESAVGANCRIMASVIEESTMENEVDVGPFSHLRPGTHLESLVHIGNFSEIKDSRLATGAVMGHFGYVGDASIGAKVNLGAGLVTCNYDGKKKNRTIVEAGALIGSDTMLVAPVIVGEGAVTGAGAVVIEDVPAGRLAVGVPAKIRERKS